MHISAQHNRIENYITIAFPGHSEDDSLQGWKERLINIIQNVPSEIDSLKPFIQFIVEAIHPSKIYLLHSKEVTGKSGLYNPAYESSKHSAYETDKYFDLLIVFQGTQDVSLSGLQTLFELAYLKDKQVHCTLLNQGAVIEGLQNGHIFYSLHCSPENLVYDDKITAFPEISAHELTKLKLRALKEFNASMALAKDFYKNALFFQGERNSPLIAFFLNQASELTYRSVLNALNGTCKRTHEIRVLQRQAKLCAGQLNMLLPNNTAEDKRLLDLLDRAYSGARYDNYFSVDQDDLITLSDKIKLLQNAAEKLIRIRLGADVEMENSESIFNYNNS